MIEQNVALFVSAWIETIMLALLSGNNVSHSS